MAAPDLVATADGAERLVSAVLATTAGLIDVLERETALLAMGRLRDGLALEAEKSEAAGRYLTVLQQAKANIVALKRFTPASLPRLRDEQKRLEQVASRNQSVIATAKTVSEGLVKGLAEELKRASLPGSYAPPARDAPASGPLVFSGRF